MQQKKPESYVFFFLLYFPAHLVNDISLWDLTDDDLKEMDIVEKGPRKIITSFIERHAAPNDDLENSSDNKQDESLAENHRFVKIEVKIVEVQKLVLLHITLLKS